jgi:nicotinamidase-related amidase
VRQLPIPDHFDPTKLDSVWRVEYLQIAADAEAWAQQHNIPPAANDKRKIYLMLVDLQNTFCIPDYELFVAGAPDDNRRVCEFIYSNLANITKIAPTMDTHTVMQIFHPFFWTNDAGLHPDPATMISADDVRNGIWKVNTAVSGDLGNYTALCKHALHYAETLESDGKFLVTVWPYHAMLGGIGHALVSGIEQALLFHNAARHSQTSFQIKGGNPLTENYSVLRPEVLLGSGGSPIAQKNTRFVKMLLDADMVIIAGQAKSHCVAWTIQDLLDEIQAQDPTLTEKVYLLEDCTSPVVIPGVVDFTDQANEAFQRFADAGMHLVKSTDPIDSWPGV